MPTPHLLYGAAYYDEYMPEERLARDVAMMKAAHINVVRIAESTWATMEPVDGMFDFHHIDRVLDAMEEAGISVIVGTPTYAFPAWLAARHPDILAETHKGKELYGRRQNMDITNPDFLFYAERAIRALISHVAQRACVVGFQLDNETKHYDTAGGHAQALFRRALQKKYPNLDDLNAAFGLNYWSNRITSWDTFPDVRGTINGSLGAEYAKFQRYLVTRYLAWQAELVSEYRRDDQFVTQNFDFEWVGYSYGVQPDVNHFEAAKCLTVAGCDIYHPSQDKLTGTEISFGGDMTRSLKQDNYLVLETQAQGFPQWLPYDGQLRLQAFSHIASGANMVEYWHWHSLHNAAETYWKGLLSHDFGENRVYREAMTIGADFERLSPKLVGLRKENKIAIMVSNEALTGLKWFPLPENARYNTVVRWMYDALYRQNVGCDFVSAAETDLSRYKMILVPALYAAEEATLLRLRDFVHAGGRLIASFKSGFADENLKVRHGEQPYILSECCGVRYDEFTQPEGVKLAGDLIPPDAADSSGRAAEGVRVWMELLESKGAQVLARYDHPQWGKYAAITRNAYGAGAAVYLGCMTSDAALRALLRAELTDAGLIGPEQNYEFPVVVKRGIHAHGKQVVFFLNYSAERHSPCYDFANGIELLSGRPVRQGETLELAPWGVQIVEI